MPTVPMLALARTMGNPVIEGNVVTFVYQGKEAPQLMDDIHNWEESPQPMVPAGADLWTLSMTMPTEGYLEYAFLDPQTGERLPDPFNKNRVWNGINAYNYFFYMPRSKPTPLVKPVKNIPHGSVTRHAVPTREMAVGSKRAVYLYKPPVEGPVPLVFVFDGPDYLKRGKLDVIVDNMIAEKSIRPFAMAMVENGGPARSVEYSCGESAIGFLMECVLPLAKKTLDLEPVDKGRYGVIGASLGGLMALYSAMRLPQVFRRVLSQSGAFIVPEYEFSVVDMVRHFPVPDIDIWMDAGQFEWLLEGNRKMYALLKEKGYRAKYREFAGGHNYTAWRDDIWRGLEVLFGKNAHRDDLE